MSGLAAARTSVAQPPWQLPTTIGLGAVGMEAADFSDEFGFGAHHVGERLARLRHRAEHDEIDRVAVVQGDADLAVGLEAADAGAVAGARVDDHVGPLPVEGLRRPPGA